MKKEVEEVVEKYKASEDFVAEKTRARAIIHKSKEFVIDCRMFDQEAFEKGHNLGKLECQAQVMKHHLGLELAYLDE